MLQNYSDITITVFSGSTGVSYTARICPLVKLLETYNIKSKMVLPIRWQGKVWQSAVREKVGSLLSVILTHPFNEYLNCLAIPPKLVIIGRVASPQIYLLLKFLKARGVKVIFDLDDNPFFGSRLRPGSLFMERIMEEADFVIVNGHYLQGSVKRFTENVGIIPDPIDTNSYSSITKNKNDKITITWEGNPRGHYDDLALLIKPLLRLSVKFDVRLKIISYLGDPKVKKMFEKLEESMEIDYGSKDWVSIDNYPKLLSESSSDIMVAPLQKAAWNYGKSALRVGMGMALGIPVVASPIGEQKCAIKHGVNGLLAESEEEWYLSLKTLIEDETLRCAMGKNGRETVEKEFSSQIVGWKLHNILATLINTKMIVSIKKSCFIVNEKKH